MVRKKGRIAMGRYRVFGLIALAAAVSALWCRPFVSLADTTGKVTVGSAKIREKADTGSEVVGSAVQGAKVTILNEVKDSSGMTWYEVYIDGETTGYLRSDLVEKEGGDAASQTASDTGNNDSQSEGGQEAVQPQATASGASIDPETVMDAQYASVSSASINVRTAPTAHEALVEKLSQGTQVVVSGQSAGSDGDGKTWYYVTFTGADGAEKTGYIRSDLLTMGDMVPVPEETPEPEEAPEPEPEEPVNNDYELSCEKGEDGSDVWYLYDHTGGTGQSDKYLLDQLMEATKARSEAAQKDAKNLVRQRIVIVVLAVLLVIAIVVVIVMALKLRDAYYEDYDEEDDEEEEEEEERPRRRRVQEEEETPRRRRVQEEEETPRRRRVQEEEETPRRRRVQEEEEAPRRRRTEEETPVKRRSRAEEETAVEDAAAKAAATKRKTKNFLLDDDEFEFEFLNMDDKDL